jgi:hypothetical protein
MLFKSYKKLCKECNVQLTLNNSRDIVRKNFCSHSCRAKFYEIAKHGNVALMSTPEANAKKVRKGELNGRWIKDRSLVKTRSAHENYVWKRVVMTRDKFTCQNCEKIGGKLQVHHKAPYKLFKNLRWVEQNGITLCEPCHKKLHTTTAEIFGGMTARAHKDHYANY